MYRLIINGKLSNKVFNTKDELLKELSKLNQVEIYSINWVKV